MLGILEAHYRELLQDQHPEIRGTVTDRALGVNPTQQLFVDLCEKTLGLEPNG